MEGINESVTHGDLSKQSFDPSKLRAIRGARKQKLVAAAVGCTPQHLCRLEKGGCKPSPDMLRRLCVYYEVEIGSLFSSEASA